MYTVRFRVEGNSIWYAMEGWPSMDEAIKAVEVLVAEGVEEWEIHHKTNSKNQEETNANTD